METSDLYQHIFVLYIPTVCSCRRKLPPQMREEIFEEASQVMSNWFGGGTRIDDAHTMRARGFYISKNMDLIKEDVDLIIYSNANARFYNQYKEAFVAYAKNLAIRLGQEAIAISIDGQLEYIYPPQTLCAHSDASQPEAPLNIQEQIRSIRRRGQIQTAIERLSDCESVRELFCDALQYSRAEETIPAKQWPAHIRRLMAKGSDPVILADQKGFQIVFVELIALHLYPSQEREIAAALFEIHPGWRGLLVITDADRTAWHLVNIKSGGKGDPDQDINLRRLVVGRQIPSNQAVRQLERLRVDQIGVHASAEEIQACHDKVFERHALTDQFFAAYLKLFGDVEKRIEGFSTDQGDLKRLFTQTLFNRLMFLIFVQKKGWLCLEGSTDYLTHLWRAYSRSDTLDKNFYRDRLELLFFGLLNTPEKIRTASKETFGTVPYLNGGLFARESFENLEGIRIPDASIEQILTVLFDEYDFTVTESTAIDQEMAIDPEMLGRVFEELINDSNREEQGAYYTPKPVVSYMCQEALKTYLKLAVPDDDAAIDDFVENADPGRLKRAEPIWEALKNIRICDPACGSGAYLHEMLLQLTNLRLKRGGDPYTLKLDIIQNNLYGVDLDAIAVNIARLRLWLSLAVDQQGESPIPLPNLDFKIEVGNSLTAPNPTFELQQDAFRELIASHAAKLQDLLNQYATCDADAREALRQQILETEDEIRKNQRGYSVPDGAFDWRIRFSKVFVDGGFDVILANPPYVKAGRFPQDAPLIKKEYGDLYDGKADLYVYFYYRALQLLKPNGILMFISSDRWVTSSFAAKLRAYLFERANISRIIDFGDLPVFQTALAHPLIVSAVKKPDPGKVAPKKVHFTPVTSLEPPYPDIQELAERDGFDLSETAIHGERWLLADQLTLKIIQQMEQSPQRLIALIGEDIYSGIKTGANDTLIIDQASHDRFLSADPKSEHVLRPIIKGDNIKKWIIEPPEKWLIFFPNHGEDALQEYPAIQEYLLKSQEKLEKRGDRGEKWWQLRPCTYYDVFAKPKILYQEIATYQRFALDTSGVFTNNKVFMIPGGDLYLLGLLNSKWAWIFLKATCPQVQSETLELQTPYLLNLPVPKGSDEDRRCISGLVQECLERKGSDVGNIEKEIDERVAKLFGIPSDLLNVLPA